MLIQLTLVLTWGPVKSNNKVSITAGSLRLYECFPLYPEPCYHPHPDQPSYKQPGIRARNTGQETAFPGPYSAPAPCVLWGVLGGRGALRQLRGSLYWKPIREEWGGDLSVGGLTAACQCINISVMLLERTSYITVTTQYCSSSAMYLQ